MTLAVSYAIMKSQYKNTENSFIFEAPSKPFYVECHSQ